MILIFKTISENNLYPLQQTQLKIVVFKAMVRRIILNIKLFNLSLHVTIISHKLGYLMMGIRYVYGYILEVYIKGIYWGVYIGCIY